MGRPPSCDCHCVCPCPEDAIVLESWTEQTHTINLDLNSYANFPSRPSGTAWIWYIALSGTGDIADGTKYCLRQGGDTFTGGYTINIIAPQAIETRPAHPAFWPIPVAVGRVELDGTIIRSSGYGGRRHVWVHADGGGFIPCPGGAIVGDLGIAIDGVGGFGTVPIDVATSIEVISDFPFEFSLCVKCICCDDPDGEQWWSEYEQTDLGDNGPASYRPRMSDDLRQDRFVASVSRRAACPPASVVALGNGELQDNAVPVIHVPSTNHARLRSIYGGDFSYWGPWCSHTSPFVADFSGYDLERVKVLWLGSSNTFITIDDWNVYRDRYASGTFNSASLDPLRDWLDLGDRVLVIEGGWFPLSFLSALGLATTFEPLLVVPTTTPSLNVVYGGYQPLWVDLDSPGCSGCVDDGFGQPRIESTNHPFSEGLGTNLVEIVPLNLGSTSVGFCHTNQALTLVLVLAPGGGAVTVGTARGRMWNPLVAPSNCDLTAINQDLNYPAIVAEPWSGNATSRIVISDVCNLRYSTAAGGFYEYGYGLSHMALSSLIVNFRDKRLVF